MRKSRVTFNVNPVVSFSEQRVAKLFNVLDRWKPEFVLCMGGLNPGDGGNIVNRIIDRMAEWDGRVIYRHYDGKEDGFWKYWGSGKQHADALLSQFGNRVIHHLGNEPRPGTPDSIRAMCRHAREFGERMVERNARAVLINAAVGSYNRDQLLGSEWHDLWRVLADNAGRRLPGDNFAQISLGTHSAYSAMPLPLGCAGVGIGARIDKDAVQPERWATWADILRAAETSSNWHFFRDLDMLYQMADVTGADPFSIEIHHTEGGGEAMPDMEVQPVYQQIIRLNGGRKPRGTPTWDAYLRWAYADRGWTPGRAYAEMLGWWERVAPPFYRSLCLFSWTYDANEPLRWSQDYGHQDLDEFHQEWVHQLKKLSEGVTPVIELTNPKPGTTTVGLNLRAAPATSGNRIAVIPANAPVEYDDSAPVSANGYVWWEVRYAGATGYAVSQFIKPAAPPVKVETMMVQVPFVTQLNSDAGADDYNNDCGPAALAMVLRYCAARHPKGYAALANVTPDELSAAIGKTRDAYTTRQQLADEAVRRNVELDTVEGLPFLLEHVGRAPVIALIDYKDIPGRVYPAFDGAHFVVVTGCDFVEDDDGIDITAYYIHDPLGTAATGADFRVEARAFEAALAATPGNATGYALIVIDEDTWDRDETGVYVPVALLEELEPLLVELVASGMIAERLLTILDNVEELS